MNNTDGRKVEIKNKILDPDGYVDRAEAVIKKLKDYKIQVPGRNGEKKVKLVTTSQIRNLMAMTSDIYNEVVGIREETLPGSVTERIQYLRLRFIYESGREESVKAFVEEAKLLQALQEIKGKRQNFIIFSRYMEALVAYRKYYGGND